MNTIHTAWGFHSFPPSHEDVVSASSEYLAPLGLVLWVTKITHNNYMYT